MDDMDEWVEKMAATYQRVRQLQDLGQNEEGLALGLTLIEPTRRVLGEVTEDMAEVCATVGILARRAGRLDLAVEHQRRALEIRIALFGNRDLSVAASLSNLGTVYLEAQSLPEAESCYRQALEIKEQLPDGDLLGLAFTRNNLASVLALNGDRAGAERLLLTAVAEAERAEAADWRTVHILSNLARTYWGVKRLADAAPVIERALEIGCQVLPPGHYLLLDQRDLLGQCLLGLGRSAEATAVLAEAAQDHLDQFGADDVRTINAYTHLSQACLQSGALDQGESAAQRVLDNAEPRSLHYASALNTLATIHRQMGRLERATSEYEQAIGVLNECAEPDDPLLGVVLGNLGAVLRQRRAPDTARSLFERAVTIMRASEHEMLPQTLNNYGVLALEMGDHAKAELLWRETAELYNSGLYPDRDAKLAILLVNLGELLAGERRFGDAEPLLREANERKLRLLGPEHPERIPGLVNLARVCIVTGRPDEGLRLLTEAGTLREQALWRVFARSGTSERREAMDQLLAHHDAVLTAAVVHLRGSDEAAKTAFERVLRGKALSAEVVLGQYRAAAGTSSQGTLEQLFQVSSELSRAVLTTGAGIDADALQATRDQLEAQLAQETSGGGVGATLSGVSADAVAAAVAPGGIFVEYVRFQERDFEFPAWSPQAWREQRYAAFVLSSGDTRLHLVNIGAAAPVDKLVTEFRQAVARGGEGVFGIERGPDHDEVQRLGVRVREAVFDPVAARFPPPGESAQPLIIAPDGALAMLPFVALPSGRPGLLLDDYVISYLPTGRKLLDRPPAGQASPALVIASPDFDLGVTAAPVSDFNDGYFPPLPASGQEGEVVAGLLGVQPFSGAAATGELLTSARSPRIVHIATHAFFVPGQSRHHFAPGAGRLEIHPDPDSDAMTLGFLVKEQDGTSSGRTGTVHKGTLGRLSLQEAPYRSGLAFTGANAWLQKAPPASPVDAAVLTADRIACLDLSATELMVLSACETGLGDITREEGVLGLRWACAVSGARSVLMSLWKIPDDETRLLMEAFYRNALSGVPRAEALRAAQLSLRAARQDPFYWGAFALEGSAGPLA